MVWNIYLLGHANLPLRLPAILIVPLNWNVVLASASWDLDLSQCVGSKSVGQHSEAFHRLHVTLTVSPQVCMNETSDLSVVRSFG